MLSSQQQIISFVTDHLQGKTPVWLCTIIKTWGSSPRPVGSRMIVNDKGDFSGSVSGGCVETAVVRECLNILKNNNYFSLS